MYIMLTIGGPQLCLILTTLFWIAASYYFVTGATDWTVPAAEARNHNQVWGPPIKRGRLAAPRPAPHHSVGCNLPLG